MNSQKTPKIKVLVRKRPISKKQVQRGDKDIIQIANGQTVILRQQKVKVDLTPFIDEYKFNFDGAYDETSTNQHIYQNQVKPLINCAFDGAKVLCFAYGQTGSGKTYTMLGDGNQVHGLYLLAASDIFSQLAYSSQPYEIWVSFYEIYCGKLFDLLNQRNVLVARQDAKNNVNIVGLSQRKVISERNLMETIQYGTKSRVTAQNSTNADSSRSHAILQISLKKGKKVHGKISFIDLAGSERAADHADQIHKQTRIDGAEINKSLLALKQCIRALDLNKNHTPFRGSKLTMVLKDSFIGYCRTIMIGNISPNSSSSENTLNTLKYADRVKQLKKPIKDACEPVNGDDLDLLNIELMLPRQLVNHTRWKSTEKGYKQEVESKSTLYDTPQKNQNRMKNSNVYSPVTKNITIENDRKQINISKGSINSQKKLKQNKNVSNKEKASRSAKSNRIASQNTKNILIQQQQPEQKLSFEQLGKKHSIMVGNLIKQEQQLIASHENHVKQTIELAKKQMKLLSLADDPENNFQQYLMSLQNILQMQLQSIIQLKSKVKKVMANCKESQVLERKYVEASYNNYMDVEQDNLLQNQQRLFSR